MNIRSRFAAIALAVASTSAFSAEPPQQGLPAEVIKLAPQVLEERLEAVGTLLANEAVVIRPERTGRILALHFEEGKPIKAGQKLFSLEASTETAALRQVEASRDLSKVEYNQAEQLLNKKLGSRHERDKAMAQLNIDEARVNLARTALDKMDLYAPFSGHAGLRRVSVGDYVTSGQDLLQVVDIKRLKLDFHLPEKHLARLSTTQHLTVTTEALPGEQFDGEIYAISPQIDPRSRSVELRAYINNPDQRLLPGLFTRVSLLLTQRPRALLVPEQAIIPRGRNFFVYRVVDEQIDNVEVTLGLRRDGQVEITSGLSEGDVIVIAGQLKLQPGSPVTPVFAKKASDSAAETL